MHLTLVVPGLLDVVAASADADAAAGALAALLATAPPAVHADAIGVVCTALGIARQRDWPVAPLLAAAANLDPGNAYWLLAEPVTLVAGRSEVRLAAVVDDLSAEESAALLAALNAHFSGDDLRFFGPQPTRWLLAAASAQKLDTHPAHDALDASISAFLPDGPDGARWRRWQSEMQMLLFEHPVNTVRERDGRPQVNGVWLSGGGTRDAGRATPGVASLYADAALPRDLACACGVVVAPAPASLAAWRDTGPQSPSLVWLDDIAANDRLEAFDRDWAAPLGTMLDARAVDKLDVVVTGRESALSFAPRRRSLRMRWRGRFAPARLSALLAAVR